MKRGGSSALRIANLVPEVPWIVLPFPGHLSLIIPTWIYDERTNFIHLFIVLFYAFETGSFCVDQADLEFMCSVSWSWTCDSPALGSWLLGLWAFATMSSCRNWFRSKNLSSLFFAQWIKPSPLLLHLHHPSTHFSGTGLSMGWTSESGPRSYFTKKAEPP